MKPLSERFQFFCDLDSEFRSCSANVGKVIFGDLNSRIGHKLPGEGSIIGDHTFGRQAVHQVEAPNRDLLLEFCGGNGLLVANTFLPASQEEKVTFMEAGSTFTGPVTEGRYNMLDLLLCDSVFLRRCLSLRSIRDAALATDHYLVKAELHFEMPIKTVKGAKDLMSLDCWMMGHERTSLEHSVHLSGPLT